MKETIYDRVKEILEQHPRARESYPVLHRHFYCTELSFFDALKGMYEGELPKLSTVERARRLVQREHPELRGETYDNRIDREAVIRESINIDVEQTLINM
jgi:hypothetical protein